MRERDLFIGYGILLDEPREHRDAAHRERDGRRFLNLLHRTEEGHWLWRGQQTRDGHGTFTIGDRRVSAKVFSWEMANGEVPEDHVVVVTCEQRTCVFPEHLMAMTRADLMRQSHRLREITRPQTPRAVEFRARRRAAISTSIPHVEGPPPPLITRLSTPPHARIGHLSTAASLRDDDE